MQTFKDNDGRSWSLRVDVNANRRVKELCHVDLFAVLDGELVNRLLADPELLVNVIYALCKPEADAAQITDEQFGGRMVGDAIDGATTALFAALTDFFPQRRRQVIKMALAKVDAIQTAAVAQATAKLDAMNPDEIVRQALGGQSSNLPASAELTPDR